MAIRLTGMNSGLDTETIIKEMVQARQVKVDKLKKSQTSLEWKQDIWKSLNTKIFNFHRSVLSDLRYQGSFSKKVSTVSNSKVASVITDPTAMNSVQKLKIDKIAQEGYLTGKKITKSDGTDATGDTSLTELGIAEGSSFEITVGKKTTEITVDKNTTIKNLLSDLQSAGVSANFDPKAGRFYIGAKESGKDNDFHLTATTAEGADALSKMGILSYDDGAKAIYKKYADMDTDSAAKDVKLNEMYSDTAASYAARRKTIKENIETLNTNMAGVKAAYEDAYGSDLEYGDFDDLVNNVGGSLDALKDRFEELKAIDSDTITEDELNELRKLTGIKSFVDGHETLNTDLDTLETELAEVNTYIDDDGAATDKLKGEIQPKLEAKIAESKNMIANWTSFSSSGNATKIEGLDSEIYLNNVWYSSSSNTFDINGLTITCHEKTGENENVTISTQDDVSGIYDMVKKFVTGYSSLINEMDKLYNAESTKGYQPLTDEEKDAMSEKEIEKWEDKVKDSLLRRDDTLSSVSNAMKEIMAGGISINGKTMYLSDFGIETLGYFEAGDNEKSAYHINGDEDDPTVADKEKLLKKMISTEPQTVMDFFNKLSETLYNKITDLGSSVEGFSSSYTLYDNLKMKSDYTDYATKIKEAERKLKDYEDKWYQKFSAMEVALAKMQSNANAITGLLGGGA